MKVFTKNESSTYSVNDLYRSRQKEVELSTFNLEARIFILSFEN